MPCEEIERLYHVFSRYRRPAELVGCPCCTSSAEAELLLRKPLRALAADELEHYAFKALSTWGTLDDYKYFLPRIFELTYDGSLVCNREVTLGKCPYGGFDAWPADEQQAVRDFVWLEWRAAVQAGDTGRADEFLCGAAPILQDVQPLLDYADTVSPEFKPAYAAEHSNQTRRKVSNNFWDRTRPAYRQVLSWLYPEQ